MGVFPDMDGELHLEGELSTTPPGQTLELIAEPALPDSAPIDIGEECESAESFEPFIYTVEREPGGEFSTFAALRLDALCTGLEIEERARRLVRERQVKFLQCAAPHESGQSLPWRFVFRPELPAEIVLLSRVSAPDALTAASSNRCRSEQLFRQLELLQPQYEFVPICSSAQFEDLFRPFPIEYLAEFRRPEVDASTHSAAAGPFEPAEFSSDDWLHLCARLDQPLLIAISLSPIALAEEHRQMLAAGRVRLGGAVGFLAGWGPTKDRNSIQNSTVAGGAEGDSFLCVQVHVASQQPLPGAFMEALAGSLAGAGWDSSGNLRSFRYTWQVAQHREQLQAGLHALLWQEPDFWMTTQLPAHLRHLTYCFAPNQLKPFARLPIRCSDGEGQLLPVRSVPPIRVGKSDEDGILVGLHRRSGKNAPVRIQERARLTHTAILGGTGTGKTTLMERMIMKDIARGRGVGVLDPHGDLAARVLANLPASRWDETVYLDFSDLEYPVGLNIFASCTSPVRDELLLERAIQNFIAILTKLYPIDMIGPICQLNLVNALKLIQWNPARPATLVDLPRCFVDRAFRAQLVENCEDGFVRNFWREIDAQSSQSFKGDMLQYIISKVTPFMDNALLRNILGQPRQSFDLRQVIESGQIFIVNLAKGILGERNSYLLGMILLYQIEQICLSRKAGASQPWFLYLDEFHHFATEHFSSMLSELRKFSVGMVLANQCFAQIDEKMRDSILANVGSLVAFRVSSKDAGILDPLFFPHVNPQLLCRLPNYQAVVRTVGREGLKYFTVDTPAPLPPPPQLATQALSHLRRRCARPRVEVSEEICASFNPS
jgi:hypothetical protein